eukprot:6491715-Amphidinium_carterae.4
MKLREYEVIVIMLPHVLTRTWKCFSFGETPDMCFTSNHKKAHLGKMLHDTAWRLNVFLSCDIIGSSPKWATHV